MNLLGIIPKVALPPWLNIKWIGGLLVGLAFFALILSLADTRHKAQRLQDFQTGVIAAVSTATVEADKNGKIALLQPAQIVPAINGLNTSYVSAKRAIGEGNRAAAAAKSRADVADAALTKQIATDNARYAAAGKRIAILEDRPAVAPEKICPTIEEDTKSAWTGWKR